MITWINYAIYLVISFVNIGMYYLLLTPKKSVIRATAISFIVLLPFTYFKFFSLTSSSTDIILSLINNVIMIVLAKLMVKENIVRCLIAWFMILLVFMSSSAIWALFPVAQHDVTSIMVTVIYLCNVPYLLIVYFIVYKIYKKTNAAYSGKSGIILLASMCIFALLEPYVIDQSDMYYGIDNSTIGIAVCVLIGLQPFVAMLINELIVHNEMYKHERKMIEFELDNEKQYHEIIMEQGDSLAKIRHDIADQVFVIRNIAQNEPERAYTMMQELEEKITQELKYAIHAE